MQKYLILISYPKLPLYPTSSIFLAIFGFIFSPALLDFCGYFLSNRYRPPTFHVQAWYDEVKDFSYPYEHECNPYCPFRCSGPVCTHYTQVCFGYITLYSFNLSSCKLTKFFCVCVWENLGY